MPTNTTQAPNTFLSCPTSGGPSLYSRLRDAGYQVGSVGKLDLHKATFDWGIDGQRCMKEWGFTHGLDSEGKLDAMQSYLKNGRSRRGIIDSERSRDPNRRGRCIARGDRG